MQHLPRLVRSLLVALAAIACVATGALVAPVQAQARADIPPQPGDFRGRGFDQCHTPSSAAMTRWMVYSPFQAVGIYISGNQRACRSQPNLTASWVKRQVGIGWRLLAIDLGPQPRCNPRFPRYGEDDIATRPYNRYQDARFQGVYEARDAMAAAKRLGIPAGSTLWYDLEGFNIGDRANCAWPALAFLDGWTGALRGGHYVPGVYSSAASGMKLVFGEKTNPSSYRFRTPDRVWIADWDGRANLFSEFLDRVTYLPGDRLKQYRGGHNETWGGYRINIDSNWLALGAGARPSAERTRCGSVGVNFKAYPTLRPGSTFKSQIRALQCLLQREDAYDGPIDGIYDRAVINAANAWLKSVGRIGGDTTFSWNDWMALLSHGPRTTIKHYSNDPSVRRLQRTLNAAMRANLEITGNFNVPTHRAVKDYQALVGLPTTGYVMPSTWWKLNLGARR